MQSANPSAVVKAELAFARLAQEKGQWTAFRETADKDAVMFVPQTVNAQTWLRKQADPAQAVAWQPLRVFASCDGSYAASTGPWQRADGSQGTFTTIWRRQKNGSFKWVVDFGSATIIPKVEDQAIDGKVADCARGRGGPDEAADAGTAPVPVQPPAGNEKPRVVEIPNPPPQSGTGQSHDGSLRWAWTNGAREQSIEVTMRYQGGSQQVIHETAPVAAP